MNNPTVTEDVFLDYISNNWFDAKMLGTEAMIQIRRTGSYKINIDDLFERYRYTIPRELIHDYEEGKEVTLIKKCRKSDME